MTFHWSKRWQTLSSTQEKSDSLDKVFEIKFQVRLGAVALNLEGKGYDCESLVAELNKKEISKYRERCHEGRSYLRRFYIHIPKNINEYFMPSLKSIVAFNIQDARCWLFNVQ